MVRRAPQQSQDDPGQGHPRLPALAARAHRQATPASTQIVRELITASGSTFANPPANYYRVARDPQNLAETTAQLFFGIRMQCAKCHNHPFERWTQDDYYSMAAFFARVKQKKDPMEPGADPKTAGAEIIYGDRAGEVHAAAHRQDDAAEVHGRRHPDHRARQGPPRSAGRLDDVGRQPVLRQVDGQPHLVPPRWARASSIRSTISATPIRRPTTNCSTPWPRTSSTNKFDVKHLIRTIMNVADLSAQRPGQRVQQGRQQVFLARGDQAADGRAAARRHLHGDGGAGEVRRACRWARGRCSCPTATSIIRS